MGFYISPVENLTTEVLCQTRGSTSGTMELNRRAIGDSNFEGRELRHEVLEHQVSIESSESTFVELVNQQPAVRSRHQMPQPLQVLIEQARVVDGLVHRSQALGAKVFRRDRDDHPIGRDHRRPGTAVEIGRTVNQDDLVIGLRFDEFTQRVLDWSRLLGTGRIEVSQTLIRRTYMNAVESSFVNQTVPIAEAPVIGEQSGHGRFAWQLLHRFGTKETLADGTLRVRINDQHSKALGRIGSC